MDELPDKPRGLSMSFEQAHRIIITGATGFIGRNLAEKLHADYLGAVKCENIFSIDVGPNYDGRLRDIDVETLQKVGEMIRNPAPKN